MIEAAAVTLVTCSFIDSSQSSTNPRSCITMTGWTEPESRCNVKNHYSSCNFSFTSTPKWCHASFSSLRMHIFNTSYHKSRESRTSISTCDNQCCITLFIQLCQWATYCNVETCTVHLNKDKTWKCASWFMTTLVCLTGRWGIYREQMHTILAQYKTQKYSE